MRWQGFVKQNKRLPTEAHSYLTEISILLFAMSLSFTPGLYNEILVWLTCNMNKTDQYSSCQILHFEIFFFSQCSSYESFCLEILCLCV